MHGSLTAGKQVHVLCRHQPVAATPGTCGTGAEVVCCCPVGTSAVAAPGDSPLAKDTGSWDRLTVGSAGAGVDSPADPLVSGRVAGAGAGAAHALPLLAGCCSGWVCWLPGTLLPPMLGKLPLPSAWKGRTWLMLRVGPGTAGVLTVGALELPGKLICGRSCDWPRLPPGGAVLLTGREGAGVAVVLPAGTKLLALVWHTQPRPARRRLLQAGLQQPAGCRCSSNSKCSAPPPGHLEELEWALNLPEDSEAS